jgi:hypothetical protein
MAKIQATSGRGIIGRAGKLELGYSASIAQVKSQAGIRNAQRRGPLLYNLSVTIEPCILNSDIYYEIMEEILALNYGTNTLEFKLDKQTATGNSITTERGAWSGSPTVDAANQSGQNVTITVSGQNNITGYAKSFDYVQFNGSTKVHQVAPLLSGNQILSSYQTSASGSVRIDSSNVGLNLNTPLAGTPSNGSAVVFGRDVLFNMAMMEKPNITYLPGNVVEFGDFKFEEVIQ